MAVSAPAPSIPSGEHVQLSLPHVGLLPATVASVEAGAIVLVLAVKDNRVQRLVGQEVAVEYKTGRGVQRFGGILQIDSGETLRVVLQGDAERIQRREWARVGAVLPVSVKGIDEPVGGETQTLNISGGGVLIKDKWNMPLGIDVRIELQAEPGAEPIRALGRVVRVAGQEEKGVRIDSISREDEERLVRLVRERELAAARMARGR
ncbi:MAG TPA: PilZ domain-containing protein [Solirubrobacteraceae bacterium]|jgi:c-di-GMP-binding flagellar brake protein YcgR|nr:PilZ domain-containing protein [Solirubrobacteraceae bacterium]